MSESVRFQWSHVYLVSDPSRNDAALGVRLASSVGFD